MIWICKKATGGCGFAAPHFRFEMAGLNGTEISCPVCKQDHAELLNIMDFDDQTAGCSAEQVQQAKSLLNTKLFPLSEAHRNRNFSGR